jgi:hypothetical protein
MVSINPAAMRTAPIMSDEIVFPAGMKAAPAPRAMMQMPATEMLRPRARADILASSLVAIAVLTPATPRGTKGS